MKPLECILLIDDDETTNYLHESLLEYMGVGEKILVATNGQEALELIARESVKGSCPQLVLLDINMLVMNGFEFLKAYQDLPLTQPDGTSHQSVVIMMLTTSMNPHDVGRAEGLVSGFLNKPLTEEMVNHILETYFSTR